MAEFDLIPREVPQVKTPHRQIVTPLPVPESLAILEQLHKYEPRSMGGQPPIIWHRADGASVEDAWGNKWIDWSSGVLVANAGHSHPAIRQAMRRQIDDGLIFNYCFPTAMRARLVAKLAALAPAPLRKVFLLTTGSEATECAIKLARTRGLQKSGTDKITIVSFSNSFHGRTMGAQMAGGVPALKQWIINQDANMVQVPFPDGFRCPDTSFELFTKTLEELGIRPEQVAGVMSETYQGGGASFAPVQYMQQLRRWCDDHDALLIFDEVQAGFGRCGTWFGFEHYQIVPDLFCCGKGISSGAPLSAVIGRPDVLDLYPPGSMTSTHSGNPVPVAGALANLDVLENEKLVDNAREKGMVLHSSLQALKQEYADFIGAVHGKGLVAAMHMVKPGGKEPDAEIAHDIIWRCVCKGLLMFAPVGFGGASVKIAPPLCISSDELAESLEVLAEAVREAVAQRGSVGSGV
jgi:4-aminobutyrate aminotransferase-like enzyme